MFYVDSHSPILEVRAQNIGSRTASGEDLA
jgi:hypothetical protein